MLMSDHSFYLLCTCLFTNEWTMPAFISGQSISPCFCWYSFSYATKGSRLSWPEWFFCLKPVIRDTANTVTTIPSHILPCWKLRDWKPFTLLSLAYAVNLVQPLSGGIGSGVKSWQTTFKLVHWAVVYDVWHGLGVSTNAPELSV